MTIKPHAKRKLRNPYYGTVIPAAFGNTKKIEKVCIFLAHIVRSKNSDDNANKHKRPVISYKNQSLNGFDKMLATHKTEFYVGNLQIDFNVHKSLHV